MGDVTIKVRENGPLLINGSVEIFDHEGRIIRVDGDNVALCRCGSSSRKPFCDGTHRTIGFSGACAPDVFV
jgi:CDGSH-type Zn-finger protein